MAAFGVSQPPTGEDQLSTRYQVEKLFYDYAENIEAVNIHYACTPLGEVPDWNSQRVTRFLPLIELRLRRKTLKLPARILDPNGGQLTDRYLLHHYFEIFADGDTLYSQLYTEEVLTGAGNLPTPDAVSNKAGEPSSDFQGISASSASTPMPEASPPTQASKRKRSTATKGT
jgi:hypothetical protein